MKSRKPTRRPGGKKRSKGPAKARDRRGKGKKTAVGARGAAPAKRKPAGKIPRPQAGPVKKAVSKAAVRTPDRLPKKAARPAPKAVKGKPAALKPRPRPSKEQSKSKGSSVDAFCPRCKAETAHTVSVMIGSKVWRVKCAACSTEHNFHRSQLLKLRSAREEEVEARRRKEIKNESRSAERAYDEHMIGRNVAQAKRYNIKDKYYLEDVVNHPAFGLGLVTRVKEDGKVEILFKAGLKVLAHNRFMPATGKKG